MQQSCSLLHEAMLHISISTSLTEVTLQLQEQWVDWGHSLPAALTSHHEMYSCCMHLLEDVIRD